MTTISSTSEWAKASIRAILSGASDCAREQSPHSKRTGSVNSHRERSFCFLLVLFPVSGFGVGRANLHPPYFPIRTPMLCNFHRVTYLSVQENFRINSHAKSFRSTIMNTDKGVRTLRNSLRWERTNDVERNMFVGRFKNRLNVTMGALVHNGTFFLSDTNFRRTLTCHFTAFKETSIKCLLRESQRSFCLCVSPIRRETKGAVRMFLSDAQEARAETVKIVVVSTEAEVRKDSRRRINQVVGEWTNAESHCHPIFR